MTLREWQVKEEGGEKGNKKEGGKKDRSQT
jgi:hypothetical protein